MQIIANQQNLQLEKYGDEALKPSSTVMSQQITQGYPKHTSYAIEDEYLEDHSNSFLDIDAIATEEKYIAHFDN